MTAFTDRALLRRAYPDGFLAVPGLATVGGWRCVGGPDEHSMAVWLSTGSFDDLTWSDPIGVRAKSGDVGPDDVCVSCDGPAARQAAATRWNAYLKLGDLLPLFDPSDVASWAILLVDLAKAVGLRVEGATGFIWEQGRLIEPASIADHGPIIWNLRVYYPEWEGAGYAFTRLSLDPAEALCQARASLREKKL